MREEISDSDRRVVFQRITPSHAGNRRLEDMPGTPQAAAEVYRRTDVEVYRKSTGRDPSTA